MKTIPALFFLLLSLQGSAQNWSGLRPNIIWIVCEDISPYIHAYGEKAVKTPNLDKFASESIKYNYAFTVAGVCAPSRSALITGMYPTSIGTQHMRTKAVSQDFMAPGVPGYSAVIPENVRCFPEWLRLAEYYTTNNEKTDYQFDAPVTVWDENGPAASYKSRPKDKPFFAVFNLFITHESQLARKDSLRVDPATVTVPPFYADTKLTRESIARNLTNIEIMDGQVGEILEDLKQEGLWDQSVVFFYSDHGGPLPWMKREILDRGIHIPLIIHFPKNANGGMESNELISSVDFAPTVLSLAGVTIPTYMQGQAFLGDQKSNTPRKYIYAGRDRMDEKYDRVRAVRDIQFEYIYNYMPQQPSYQDLSYRVNTVPMMKEMLQLRDKGKLDSSAMAWFKSPKSVEELYDIKNDPYELHNLAADPKYKVKLEELSAAFKKWEAEVGDLSAKPESQMVYDWWNKQSFAPTTRIPEFIDRSYPAFFDGKLAAPPKNVGGGDLFWNSYVYGSIIKFPPEGGIIWHQKDLPKSCLGKPPEALLKKPKVAFKRHFAYQPHLTGEIQGALWTRFGYAPYSAHMSGNTSHCMCEGSGFDVDPFGRVFFPNLGQFRIEVIDTNNNAITTFGKYGNEDSGGPKAAVKKPQISLAWPVYVTTTDRHAYVADTVNRRVVRVKLAYEAEASCVVP